MMDHKQTMGVNSRVLDQKQLNIFGRISLFWSVELQGHPKQLNGGEHDWLIQTLASTVQRGMLVRQGDIYKVLREVESESEVLDGSGLWLLLPPYATRNSVVFSLALNEPIVLTEWRPGLKEFQTVATLSCY